MTFDITQLESGNYLFIVTIRNKNNELVSEKQTFFQRSNPSFNRVDTLSTEAIKEEFVTKMEEKDLRYSIRAIMMQIPDEDGTIMNELLKNKNLDAQRLYLFKYWAKKSAMLPEQAHDEYMMIARSVDRKSVV